MVTRRWRFTCTAARSVRRTPRTDGASRRCAASDGRIQPARIEAQGRDQPGTLEHPHGAGLVGVDDHGVLGLPPERKLTTQSSQAAVSCSEQRSQSMVSPPPGSMSVRCPWKSA